MRRIGGGPPLVEDRLTVAMQLASILVLDVGANDRLGLGRRLGVPVPLTEPRQASGRVREAELFEKACRERLGRLDLALLEQLQRLLSNGATPLGSVVDEAMRDRVRLGLSGEGSDGAVAADHHPIAPDLHTRLPVADDTSDAAHTRSQPFASWSALQKSPERVRISEDQVIAALGPGGSINEAMAGYEPRPGQVRMARAVTRSLNDGLRLVIEAGTGTGKSLAYLVPASMFAVANGRRVVISTNTITLQEQLFNKDIPILRKALPHDVQVAVLKGRTHYLCLRRWRVLTSSGLDGATERMLAARIAIWVRDTETGDRGELAITEAESAIWTNHLSADVMHCTSRLCRDNRSGRCFLARARRRAEGAHLLVVNHALLLTDRSMENPVLPEYDDVIVDEAHHLEAVATDQLGTTVSAREVGFELATLSQPQGGTRFGGTVARIAAVFVEAAGEVGREQVASITAPVHEACEVARVAVSALFDASTDLFDRVTRGDRGEASGHQGGWRGGGDAVDRELRLTGSHRESEAWSPVAMAWEEASASLALVERGLQGMVAAFDPFVGSSETVDDAVADLGAARQAIGEARESLTRILVAPDDAEVYWIAGAGREMTMHAAPLAVDALLQSNLYEQKSAIIMTSATIQVGGSFRHFRNRLGLPADTMVLEVASPFDYPSQALLLVPRDLPDPASPAHGTVIQDILAGVASAMNGRTLVLFTSHASLRAAHGHLREMTPHLTILGQGIDGPRSVILDRFRATPNAILLGTNSFWEGIDVVGDALSCLVIVKLPFTVPSDPVFAARSELLEDSFMQLAVPQAVLRLKQGFGRLIRSGTDRGVVAILDSRLVTRRYGQTFLGSLPPATTVHCGARELAGLVGDWMTRGPDRPGFGHVTGTGHGTGLN